MVEAWKDKCAEMGYGGLGREDKTPHQSAAADSFPSRGSHENVVHPEHYNRGKIEVWDAIADWGLGFLLGNVVKYVARAGHKGNKLEDLRKAQQYIEKAIEYERRISVSED